MQDLKINNFETKPSNMKTTSALKEAIVITIVFGCYICVKVQGEKEQCNH